MTEVRMCDDHNCRYNTYNEHDNLKCDSCQFSDICIVGGMCNKREGVAK